MRRRVCFPLGMLPPPEEEDRVERTSRDDRCDRGDQMYKSNLGVVEFKTAGQGSCSGYQEVINGGSKMTVRFF